MCDSDEHHGRYGSRMRMHPFQYFMMGDCCSDYESIETKTKRLEALKSHLQDRINAIEKRIAEMQKPGEGEEV
ncbi:MAG: hypothetical protein BV458_07330 [Thermoplasmata archaeon M9B2D]|nr:MAG: hypothetical protein BV458_07330 [Thermoplasmata archaeon M9B2D]